ELMHGPQHAAVHRLQTVANVRQRAADDHRHRVIEIRTPHLVFDVYMVPFRSCFHLKAFPVQSATQSGPVQEIRRFSWLFFGEKNRVEHCYQRGLYFSLFREVLANAKSAKTLLKSIA